jgi:integrase
MNENGGITNQGLKKFAREGKPGDKLFVGGGLHLWVSKSGAPLWRVKYRIAGTERLYSDIGAYPEVGLEKARKELSAVKEHVTQGRDPVQERRVERAKATTASFDTFAGIVSAWLEENRKGWSAIHYRKSKRAIERDVLPHLGKLPVAAIEPVMVTNMVKAILARGVRETAAKILQHVADIFEYARAHGLRSDNPATPAQTVIPKGTQAKGRPAFLTWPELGAVLRGAEAAHLSPPVRMAHRLLAFSAVRISNVVNADWSEFHLDADIPTWIIPRAKMKAKDRAHDHKIILGPTIAAELGVWRSQIGAKGYVFPSPAGKKHISREALEKSYRVTLGLADRHSPHGWRSSFSTLARENKFERDAVELALDHVHDNDVVRSYDRGERLEQRVKIMNWWDAQLSQAERGADVVPMLKRKV